MKNPYNFINNMWSFPQITSYIAKKEKEILEFNLSPKSLYEPIEYILSLGGKKIRPALALFAYNLFSEDLEDIIRPALGIEVFHNFTLMHDDLMDNADIRRGKPTIHKAWNNNVAILSGDAMLIYAYQLIATCNPKIFPEVLCLFSETAMEVCQGQQYDMEFETRSVVSKDEYLEMIRLKTAVLLGCSLKMGAMIGLASNENAQLLYDFGINLGLAFQLKDDLLDVYGDPTIFGKNIGGDIICNKKTFLLINALENADIQQKKELAYWLSAEQFDKEEKIEKVTAIYNATNTQVMCEEKMNAYYDHAICCLERIAVDNEKKKELKLLAENLMSRES